MRSRKANGRYPVALFDWDDTLHKGFTIVSWCEHLLRCGLFPKAQLASTRNLFDLYDRQEICYADLCAQSASLYGAGVKGARVADLNKAAQDFVSQDAKNILPFAKGVLRKLEEAGFRNVVVSGAPSYVLQAYSRKYAIHSFYALELVEEKGMASGSVSSNHGLSRFKAKVVRSLSRDSEILLALGNSPSDLPLLMAARIPIVVQTNGSLFSEDTQNGLIFCGPHEVEKRLTQEMSKWLQTSPAGR